jgi:hypothetical protein
MGVQRELIAEPEQLMLAAGDHFPYCHTGQIRSRQGRDSELRSRQQAASKHLVQPPAGAPHGISLRHGLIVPSASVIAAAGKLTWLISSANRAKAPV